MTCSLKFQNLCSPNSLSPCFRESSRKMASSASTSRSVSQLPASKKRKRQDTTAEELEVDITAPEPPSKKALRKARKAKQTPAEPLPNDKGKVHPGSDDGKPEPSEPAKRSEYGIWIGNLPWSASKADLRTFLTSDTNITDASIMRIHMPTPKESAATSRSFVKPQNKGFAYVDFTTQTSLKEALALSESLLTGRRVLIKDSKSFEGRPEKTNENQDAAVKSGKPPSKRVFVGNLDFDTTKKDIQEHFSRCGEVLDVHIATFEDSGKCKGYGWVEFDTVEAGQAAVRGWVEIEQKGEGGDSEDEEQGTKEKSKTKKKPRPRKWYVNKIYGRPLRVEFAEGKEVRYKKRYGKKSTTEQEASANPDAKVAGVEATVALPLNEEASNSSGPRNTKSRFSEPRKPRKIDARNIRPGAALSAAPRLQARIVPSQGKKTILA